MNEYTNWKVLIYKVIEYISEKWRRRLIGRVRVLKLKTCIVNEYTSECEWVDMWTEWISERVLKLKTSIVNEYTNGKKMSRWVDWADDWMSRRIKNWCSKWVHKWNVNE